MGPRAAKLLVESPDPAVSRMRAQILPNGHWNASGFIAALRADRPGEGNATTSLLRDLQAEEIISFFETLLS